MFKRKSYISIIFFFLTLAFIDRLIELIFKYFLHAKREQYIRNYLLIYTDKYPNLAVGNLEENLNVEADRVYDIVDRSILRERIIRGKYVFWLSAIAAVILIGSLGGFKGGSFLPFIAPCLTATIGWIGTVLTVSISYNQRVKGGLDSVITRHGKAQSMISTNTQVNQLLMLESGTVSNFRLNVIKTKESEPGSVLEPDPEPTYAPATVPPPALEEIRIEIPPSTILGHK